MFTSTDPMTHSESWLNVPLKENGEQVEESPRDLLHITVAFTGLNSLKKTQLVFSLPQGPVRRYEQTSEQSAVKAV